MKVTLVAILMVCVSTVYAIQEPVTSFSLETVKKNIHKRIHIQLATVKDLETTVVFKNQAIFNAIPEDALYVFVDYAKPETFLGKYLLDVVFLSEENHILATQKLLVETEAFGSVLVSARKIARNTKLSDQDMVFQRMKLQSRAVDFIYNPLHLVGKQTKRVMIKGLPFSDRWVEVIPDVAKKETVTMFVKSAGFEIKTQATALDSGMIGDTIRIQTQRKKIVQGEVIDEHSIRVHTY